MTSTCVNALYGYEAAVEAKFDEALLCANKGISSRSTFLALAG